MKPIQEITLKDDAFSHLQISKSNELIENPYSLSAGEHNLVNLMAARVNPMDDSDFLTCRISTQTMSMVLGAKDNRDHGRLKEIAESLMKKVIEIRHPTDVQRSVMIHWLDQTHFNFGKGYVELTFNSALKPFLLNLRGNYTKYKLAHAIFSYDYTQRIFELALSSFGKGEQRVDGFEGLKKLLNIENGKYKKYGDFKRRVLDPAQKEINEKTPYFYTYEAIKQSKAVVAVKSILSPKGGEVTEYLPKKEVVSLDFDTLTQKGNVQNVYEISEPSDARPEVLQKILDLGVNESVIEASLKKYGSEKVQKILDYGLNEKRKADHSQRKPIHSFPGFLGTCLKNGYGLTDHVKKDPLSEQLKPFQDRISENKSWLKENDVQIELYPNEINPVGVVADKIVHFRDEDFQEKVSAFQQKQLKNNSAETINISQEDYDNHFDEFLAANASHPAVRYLQANPDSSTAAVNAIFSEYLKNIKEKDV